jgi:DNA-binding transcriptional ArsR family regulator
MVEQTLSLDSIFSCLSDATRRDMLRRLIKDSLSIGELAKPYDLTFAAISKHLKVLERSNLVAKQRRGKVQMVSVVPETLKEADDYLATYRQLWEERFERLDILLSSEEEGK